LDPGARVEVRRGSEPVLLARLRASAGADGADIGATFTDRLVAKFGLPVTGWRGLGSRRAEDADLGLHQGFTAARQRDKEPGGDA
jgi:NAD+ kinase